MASIAITALAASVVGGGVSAYGQLSAAHAAAGAAKYNASIAEQNAKQAIENKNITAQAGAARTQQQELQTRATVGQTGANQAASGIDIQKGSPLAVRASESEIGGLDALTVRSNATKEAFGYEVQSVNDKSQAELDRYEAKSDIQAGQYAAAGTLIGTAGSASSNYQKYKLQGAIG